MTVPIPVWVAVPPEYPDRAPVFAVHNPGHETSIATRAKNRTDWELSDLNLQVYFRSYILLSLQVDINFEHPLWSMVFIFWRCNSFMIDMTSRNLQTVEGWQMGLTDDEKIWSWNLQVEMSRYWLLDHRQSTTAFSVHLCSWLRALQTNCHSVILVSILGILINLIEGPDDCKFSSWSLGKTLPGNMTHRWRRSEKAKQYHRFSFPVLKQSR